MSAQSLDSPGHVAPRVRIAVGAAEIEEVVIEECEHVGGEVGGLDGDLWKSMLDCRRLPDQGSCRSALGISSAIEGRTLIFRAREG